MINTLSIGNFKAFGPTQRIPIKPLTLIFGANSAGKSSVLHSILLFHEALRSGNLDVTTTNAGGKAVDLGGFKQYIHRSDTEKAAELHIDMKVSDLNFEGQSLFHESEKISLWYRWGVGHEELMEEREVPDKNGNITKIKVPTGRFVQVSEPGLLNFELLVDDKEVLDVLAVSKSEYKIHLYHDSPTIENLIRNIILTSTTVTKISEKEFVQYQAEVDNFVADLIADVQGLIPERVRLRDESARDVRKVGDIVMADFNNITPVSKGKRAQDIAVALRLFLPRQLTQMLASIKAALEERIRSLVYLGPLRSFPPRYFFTFTEEDEKDWQSGGGYAWNLLIEDADVRAEVNNWLSSPEHLQTPYEFVVRDVLPLDENAATILFHGLEEINESGIDYVGEGDSEGLVDVDKGIKDPDTEAEKLLDRLSQSPQALQQLVMVDKHYDRPVVVSHRDVGVGVSQVLPVLAYAYSYKDKLIAIEQPEIHIHPKLQAELADVFIKSALGERKNTFLLETHSEHLILRIMRRMRETFEERLPQGFPAVRPEDVSILFVEPTANGSLVREMELNARGELVKAWPGGFFEEGLKEVFA